MTSSKLSDLVQEIPGAIDNGNRLADICQQIASDVVSGNCKVHTVVEKLGPLLTNKNVSERYDGVKALSHILEKLPLDFLNETEVEFLTVFYCDRLKDHNDLVTSVVLAISVLIEMKNFPKDCTTLVVRGILQNIRCQSESRENRRLIYSIFNTLMENHLEILKSMGPDFVYGFISLMDGESDPRNLMFLFKILPWFMKVFPLGHLTEEMFEVVACYFPVDFHSARNETRKITRDALAEALAPCLYAVPEFAEFCLPLVIKKLSSERTIAQLDSLYVLSKGVKTFGSKGLRNHLNELWLLLKKKVLCVGDDDEKKTALAAVNEIIKAIADDEDLRKTFVEKIFEDTRWLLSQANLSSYWIAEKLLETIAKTEKKTCVQVLIEVVPLCLGQYSTKTSDIDKAPLMETLNNFIKISLDFNFTIGDVPELAWTDISGLYLRELETHKNTFNSNILAGLVIQRSVLKEGQRKTVYKNIAEIIDKDEIGDCRNICHSSLLAFAKMYPSELSHFLGEEVKLDIDDFNGVNLDVLKRRLEAISTLCRISKIGDAFLPKIVEMATCKTTEIHMKSLECLYQIAESMNNSDYKIHEYLYSRCSAIDRLMTEACEDVCVKKLTLVSNVCRAIVRKLEIDNQREIVEKYIKVDNEDSMNVILFEGILTPLRREIKIPNVKRLLYMLADIVVKTEEDEKLRSACRIIAVLVNKIHEDSNFDRIVDNLRCRVTDIFEIKEESAGRKKSAVVLHTWLTKALVARGSKYCEYPLEYQINMLMNDSMGPYVANEFVTLVDKSEYLVEDNFARVKIFYRQRIFHNVMSVNARHTGESRKNYLIALAHLIENVPIDLPFIYLKELVPLLIESLTLDEPQLLLSVLNTLKLLLDSRDDIFVDQIQNFLPKCLQLSTNKKMNVRIAALDCLLSYTHYPTIELVKYKQEVLDKLVEPLDDQKRLVRKIAVIARTRWYLVGSSGGLEIKKEE